LKPKIDRKMGKISLYVIITVIIIYLAIMIINNVPGIYHGTLNLLKFISKLLWPLILGGIFAFVLSPATKGIERFLENRKKVRIKWPKLRRAIGIVVSYIVILAVLVGLIIGVYFMIGGQLSKNTNIDKIISYITDYFKNNTFDEAGIKSQIAALNIPILQNFEQYIVDAISWIQSFISSTLISIASNIAGIGTQIFSIILALILSIYLLYDSEYFLNLWKKFFFMVFRNSKAGEKIGIALSTINKTFSGYIKGQLIEALLVSILCTTALMIVGIDYALIIGIIAGIFNLIPYIGPLIGTLLAATMGILDGSIWKMVWAIVAMLIVQQLDGNIFQPRIVGGNVGLHPVFIMIGIIAGGSLYGLLGMLLAVPILASAKKLISMWFRNNLQEAYATNLACKENKEDEIKNEKHNE